MRRFGILVAVAVLALVAVGVVSDDPVEEPWWPPQVGVSAAGVGLTAFDACDELVDHLAAAASLQGAMGFAGRDAMALDGGDDTGAGAAETAAPAADADTGVDVSDTNVEVAGVDEPDLVETDGQRLYTALDGRLRVVDVSTATPSLVADVALPGAEQGSEGQMLLHGDRLLVMLQGWGPWLDDGAVRELGMPAPGRQTTTLSLFDVSDVQPVLVAEAQIEGAFIAGRGVDGTAHLIVAHHPQPVPFEMLGDVWEAPDGQTAGKRLHDHLEETTAADWLPAMVHTDADGVVTAGPALDCAEVMRTGETADTAMVEVLTFDMAGGDLVPEGTAAVLTSATAVTATADQLVVSTPVWPDVLPVEPMGAPATDVAVDAAIAPEPARTTTRLHLFDLAPGGAIYRASGEVEGELLNQFSMSLHEGRLRVATTVGAPWDGQSVSGVTVLEPRGDRLEIVGQVGDLGLGERIYAVRFLGDRGYVVTFRQVDPLYTLDLSDPTAPRVLGELKITGYSAYLHPLEGDRLLGVGQEATPEGQTVGTQVSLFDVSNPATPTRLAQVVLPNSGSEAEYDHHAFLYHRGTLMVPFERWFPQPTAEFPEGFDSGAMIVAVGDATLQMRGTVSQPADTVDPWERSIRRGVIVDGTLFTVSRRAVQGISLDTLASTGVVSW